MTAARARSNNLLLQVQQAIANAAMAHVLLGDAEAAARSFDQALGEGAVPDRGLFARAAAWVRIGAGDPDGAVAVLRAAAEVDAAHGDVAAATTALHDVVRLGAAPQVAGLLADLARGADSPVVHLRARHAAAAADRDADALAAVADAFEGMGLLLSAAEAAVAAAAGYAERGEPRRAARMTARAQEWLAACEGARSPATAGLAGGAVALSAREREIARMAADGVPSRDIAAALVLSVRTVNNHLQKVYRKLGVSTRAELAAALDRA
ncbi:hypothetical protein BJF78_11700 [Pseudonocardia sp. CNS-139]|nr:hypothetical protein BJF78_11700 [Pseudonocardia sp. CNS-139]